MTVLRSSSYYRFYPNYFVQNEVRELLQNAIDEETRSLVLRGRSEGSYQSVRDLLDKIEETLFRYTTDILSINNEFLLVYLGISRTVSYQ